MLVNPINVLNRIKEYCYLAYKWEQAKLFPNVLIIMRTHNIYACGMQLLPEKI